MRYFLKYGPSVAVLPREGLESALDSLGENELKLLVFLACNNGQITVSEASGKLGISPEDIKKAAEKLRKAGLASCDDDAGEKPAKHRTPTPKELPQYSGEEIGRIIETNDLRHIIDELQRIVGTMFSTAEINKLVAMYDYLKLDGEYLLILTTHCAKIGKKSVAYIARTAFSLFDEGIDTPSKLEYHLKGAERVFDMDAKLRKLFGCGDRAWTPREKEYLQKWIGEWNYSYEVLEKAYFITVDKTQKTSLAYMNKILQNWHDNGYDTIEEVERAQEEYRRSKEKQSGGKMQSFDVNEFFDIAMKNSYRKMREYSAKNNNDGAE